MLVAPTLSSLTRILFVLITTDGLDALRTAPRTFPDQDALGPHGKARHLPVTQEVRRPVRRPASTPSVRRRPAVPGRLPDVLTIPVLDVTVARRPVALATGIVQKRP